MNEKNIIKYPKQIDSVVRKSKSGYKTLGVDSELYLPNAEDSTPPLCMHSAFSRIVFTLIEKKSEDDKIYPTANIPANEVEYIKKRTDNASLLMMQDKFSPSNTTNTEKADVDHDDNLAYTVKLLDRTFKGKTPADVLLEDAKNADKLVDIVKWLKDNIKRYPKNQLQIDAINNALDLLDTSKLSNEVAKTSSAGNNIIPIYSSGFKFKQKTNEKNMNLVYTIDVVCDTEKDYPYAVTIMNCYAPVTTDSNGLKNIKMKQAESIKKATILLTEAEWYRIICRSLRTINNFENTNFVTQFDKAKDASYHNSQNK